MLERIAGAIGALLGLLFLAAQLALGFGVVREHCLNATATKATGSIQVDSHWTYIVWPPLYFSAADPAGRCVRNSPLHEALSYIGIWKLPPPTEQVRRHIASQLPSGSNTNSTNLSPSQSGAAQQARAYIAAVAATLQPLRKPATSATSLASARATLNKVIAQLQALTPTAGASDGHRAAHHSFAAAAGPHVRVRACVSCAQLRCREQLREEEHPGASRDERGNRQNPRLPDGMLVRCKPLLTARVF